LFRESGVRLLTLGNGSNLIVRDGGVRGAILHFGDNFSAIRVQGDLLNALAGALLPRVAAAALAHELTGMEFASGIPGSIGGAATMNAGAYGGEMKDILHGIRAVTPEGTLVSYGIDQMHYGYRHSRVHEENLIVVEVTLALQHGDLDASRALLADFTARRREKQPLEMPSAGSFFKRPPGYFAGKLIEDAGCKGLSVGGAKVSEKHAGFIVNEGNATASDILALAELVTARVKAQFGVDLEREVRVVGEE
jgi:UDP-N-acetylmuramate dehydrogenase